MCLGGLVNDFLNIAPVCITAHLDRLLIILNKCCYITTTNHLNTVLKNSPFVISSAQCFEFEAHNAHTHTHTPALCSSLLGGGGGNFFRPPLTHSMSTLVDSRLVCVCDSKLVVPIESELTLDERERERKKRGVTYSSLCVCARRCLPSASTCVCAFHVVK